jgi:very-short-patch-repair endonuclease
MTNIYVKNRTIMNKLTTEIFIERAKQVHGDKYNYSKVEYKGIRKKVCIICPKHGEFWQLACSHLDGRGCIRCNNGSKPMSQEEFIEKAKKIHGDKYDYSKVEYTNSRAKVCIICPKHGEFWQKAMTHLEGRGCKKCMGGEKVSTLEDFIEKAKKIHGDKYDYSKVEYERSNKKVCIICPTHGEFFQTPNSHLNGSGCPLCGNENQTLGKEEFIRRAKEIHGNKFDYSKVEYINAETKVCIICPKHGEFWQAPKGHLRGYGCPLCSNEENISENRLYDELLHNVRDEIIKQKKFKWLRYKNPMSIDFYIPSKKIGIEYQGEQHFKNVQLYGGEDRFKIQLDRDLKKIKLCEEHGIKLLHFTYNDKIKWDEYKIYTKIEDLLEKLK